MLFPKVTVGGAAVARQPVVTVQDASGATVTTDASAVKLVITDPGRETFTCMTNPKTAHHGVATFTGCNIDRPGTYTLTLTANGKSQSAPLEGRGKQFAEAERRMARLDALLIDLQSTFQTVLDQKEFLERVVETAGNLALQTMQAEAAIATLREAGDAAKGKRAQA